LVNIAAEKKQIQINNDLLNAVTPFGGIEFFRNKILIGEVYGKIYAVTKYPPALSRGWASKITNLPNTVTCQMFEPCDNGALISDLSRSVSRYRGLANSTKDALERQRAEKAADDAESLMKKIDENCEVIGYMSNFALVTGCDEEELEKACRKLEGIISTLNCKARLLVNQMKEAFKTISPYNTPKEEVLRLTRRNVPMSTFIEGFPFASNSFVDLKGYPFGRNTRNGLVVFDPWVRESDRTNSNFIILGVLGVGKSTVTKDLMISEYMTGTTCIIIDFEAEYTELTNNLGGDLINAGGGSFIINPLQFRATPLDDDEDIIKLNESKELNAMATHMNWLDTFFRLLFDINTRQISLLKQILEMLYNDFEIDWNTDTSKLKSSDYPIFTDLYNLITDIKDKNVLNPAYNDDLGILEIMIRELAMGANSFIWNGHTTIEPKSSFINFDVSQLMEMSDNIKITQYYNLLSWAWERMSRNRDEKVLLFADEAYILIDPNVVQPLIYLRNINKRSRKYNAGLVTIFHTVTELLDPSIKLYAQPLLDMPTYKIIMGMDGKNLDDLSGLYSLSEQEMEILANKKRGVSIFFVGSRRFVINHEISQYDLDLMGKGGGK